MNTFRKLSIISIGLFMSLNLCALEMKGTDGKYRHEDSAVRAELLSIANTLYTNDMPDKSIKLYRVLAKKWQSAEQRRDQRLACRTVLSIMINTQRLDEWPRHMAGCAPSELEELFLDAGRERQNIYNIAQAVEYYLYLANNSEKFAGETTKTKACFQLGALHSRLPADNYPTKTVDELCTQESLRKGMLQYASSTIPVKQLVSLPAPTEFLQNRYI